MKIQYDSFISGLLFCILLFLFICASIAITVNTGLSSADDGFFAVAAKSFAMGEYGLPISSHEISRFDPSIGSGPALIGLGAIATLVFGPMDSLGLLSLTVFILQFGFVLVLLHRRYSLTPVLGCGFASLLMLMLASGNQWYFGVFTGEVPALGFVLLGTALLTTREGFYWQMLAGLSFALALLTKQIALFAISGVVLIWFMQLVYRKDGKKAVVALGVMFFSMIVPLLLWEIIKLSSLGLAGYHDLWIRTLYETKRMAVGDDADRLERFLSTLIDMYWPVVIVSVIMLCITVVIVWKNHKNDSVLMFPIAIWSGAFLYLIYIVALSTMWARYYFIGIGMLAFACGATLLLLDLRMRWFVICVLVTTVGIHAYRDVYGLVQWSSASGLSKERHEVLKMIRRSPGLPIAARSWHSFYDIAYLLDSDRVWVLESNSLDEILNQDFIAVINNAFGDKARFFNAVKGGCDVILGGNRYEVYTCGNKFWEAYSVR